MANSPLAVFRRRHAMRLAYWNGAIRSIGSGLASSALVVYWAQELDVASIGLGIAMILAAPHLIGLLRLGVPALIGRLGDRKQFCVATYLLSGLTLAALPIVARPGYLPSPRISLAALVAVWCAYNLFEYLGSVALWSWLADIAPPTIRGRFLGRRERWMVAGQAAAMLASGLFAWEWHAVHPELPPWIGYAVPAMVGAGFLIASVVPLVLMPRAGTGIGPQTTMSLRAMMAPLVDGRFLRLLAFGCWISFFNGMAQSPQNVFPKSVLHLSLFTMLALRVGLRLGQWPLGPGVGRWADRLGNKSVLLVSSLIVGQGPLFYLLATAEQPWWIVGAWTCWIAWVGLNVGQPNLMLKLSPAKSNTPYIATWFAITGLCHGISTLWGGWLFDTYRNVTFSWLGIGLDYYQLIFLVAWITGSLGSLLVLWVREPSAKSGYSRTL